MSRRQSSQPFSSPSKDAKAQQADGEKKNLWESLLDSVASGKRLPQKQVLIFGGSPVLQKEFIETLDSENSKKPRERNKRRRPIANEFARGYTYQDVLDADQEDASPSWACLISPLLTQATVPDTLITILLDWAEPWKWVRQLRDWIRFLHIVFTPLNDETKEVMQETMQEWQQRKRGGTYETGGTGNVSTEPNVTVPLGSGEWDEALGLPLCVACHNADKIDTLEKEYNWREEEFDYVLQFLRTVLLKHGASLIHTSNSVPNSLPLLVHSSLDIHSLLKRQPLRHNIIDREKILIPPNWDSWGKIRVIREGFDVEGISDGWSLEIQPPKAAKPSGESQEYPDDSTTSSEKDGVYSEIKDGPVHTYEDVIKNPKGDNLPKPRNVCPPLEVEVPSMQDFLAEQYEVIERLKLEEDQAQEKDARNNPSTSGRFLDTNSSSGIISDTSSRVNEHIGPVHFNMGGIQVDAEDVLNRLRDRELREETPDPEGSNAGGSMSTATPSTPSAPDARGENEALANFFAGLIKRGGTASPRTPQP